MTIVVEEERKFDTHLLSMEEVWFVREHPYNVVSVRVRKAVREVEELEDQLEEKRKALAAAITALNNRMSGKHDR